jgi:hypothetical protein
VRSTVTVSLSPRDTRRRARLRRGGWASASVGQAQPRPKGYLVNVAAFQHGFGDWRRVDGFSEAVLTRIVATEAG